MEAAAVSQHVEKKLYRNNTQGYLGIVKLDHRGEPQGENVDPGGTVWLSADEATLTARAPKRPEDSPFAEQVFIRVNPETQAREEFSMRPLTLVEDTSAYGAPDVGRYVPGVSDVPEDASPAVEHTKAQTPEAAAAPPSTGSSASTELPPAAPPIGASSSPAQRQGIDPAPAALAGQGGAEERESWVEPPEAPGRVLEGSLGGTDEAAPGPSEESTDRTPPVAGQAQAVATAPGGLPEEHAAVDPQVGEETGAAKPPAQPAPQGEYARAEEVGSPDAPETNDNDAPLIGE